MSTTDGSKRGLEGRLHSQPVARNTVQEVSIEAEEFRWQAAKQWPTQPAYVGQHGLPGLHNMSCVLHDFSVF